MDCTDLDCLSADCEEICGDGEDKDWDSLKDCADPDRLPSVACPEVCGSGVDEDDDGLVDCQDADCVGRTPGGQSEPQEDRGRSDLRSLVQRLRPLR